MSVKVKSIEVIPLSYPLNPKFGHARGLNKARQSTIIKLETESGFVGYGEAFGSPKAISSIIHDLKDYFINKEPFDFPNLSTRLQNELYHVASKGLLVCALSGIEMAAWDLSGKALGVPVYKLLGGKARETLLPYASTGYFTESGDPIEILQEQVRTAQKLNLPAIKIKIGRGLKTDIERVKAVREVDGNMKLMVDINGGYTADLAIQTLRHIEEYSIYWVEEPVAPYDWKGFEKIKQACPHIPIATGEAEYTRYGFKEIIQSGLIDIVQPDISKCGGISEAKAIAAMAQANNLRISPHVWGGIVGRSATIQFMASIPYYPHAIVESEGMILEYDIGENPLRDEIGTGPLQLVNGEIEILSRPGIGVELDLEKLEHYRIDR